MQIPRTLVTHRSLSSLPPQCSAIFDIPLVWPKLPHTLQHTIAQLYGSAMNFDIPRISAIASMLKRHTAVVRPCRH